jgi:ketosteroid isomerase-like protein
MLPNGAQLHVDDLIVTGDVAIVELNSEATARNGFRFDNHYCRICYFKNDVIVRVRAYLDSVVVARLFAENPI